MIKHAASGREIIVEGPGRVLPCRGGEEQLLVSSGRVRSVPGAGVRPGAEVWLVTPWGVVRYGDAALELGVSERTLTVTVSGGQAATDPAAGVTTLPKTVAGPGGKARATGKPNPARQAEACQRAAVAAQKSAAVLLADRPGPDLGRHARDQLEDRRRARAACAMALSAADRVSDAAQQGRLRDQLARAESLWRAVPEAPPAAPK